MFRLHNPGGQLFPELNSLTPKNRARDCRRFNGFSLQLLTKPESGRPWSPSSPDRLWADRLLRVSDFGNRNNLQPLFVLALFTFRWVGTSCYPCYPFGLARPGTERHSGSEPGLLGGFCENQILPAGGHLLRVDAFILRNHLFATDRYGQTAGRSTRNCRRRQS